MKLTSIQVLRGIAAFAVLMSHLYAIETSAIAMSGSSEAGLLSPVWEKGFAGVDLFFVISGFIMVYVTAGRERGPLSSADFLIARATRIYPLWWLFMALTAMSFMLTHGSPWDPQQFQLSGHSAPGYLINSALLLPQGGHPLLGVGWTLIHEMYFYVVFALFLLAPQKWLPALLVGWAAFVVGCDIAGLTQPLATNLFLVASYPMTLEFIAGAFTAMLVMSGRRAFAPLATLVGAGALIAAFVVFSNADSAYTLRWGRVIWFGIPATLLIYGVTSWEADGGPSRGAWPGRLQKFGNRVWSWLVKLGDISFALYLCHILAIGGMKRVFAGVSGMLETAGAPEIVYNLFRLSAPGMLDNILYVSASIVAACILATLSYRLFERPSLAVLGKWRRSFIRPISAPKRGEMVRSAVW